MSELQPLLDLLSGKISWLATALAWIGALRLVAKPVSAAVQTAFSKLVAKAIETPEPEDDELVGKLIRSWPYRILAFLVDWIASVKLPTSDSLRQAIANEDKPGPPIVLWLLCGCLVLGAGGCLTGCVGGPRTAQAQAFLTLRSVWTSADAAMKVYGTACATGRVSAAKQVEVDQQYLRFRASWRLAVSIARSENAPAPPEVQELADELQRLITNL